MSDQLTLICSQESAGCTSVSSAPDSGLSPSLKSQSSSRQSSRNGGQTSQTSETSTQSTKDQSRGGIDCITSGDPCQENSNARQGVETTSPSLGSEFIRIVSEFRPRFVLRENPSAIRHDAPWPWWRIRDSLEQLGYIACPFRIRSCCVGAVHQRERMLVLAHLPNALRSGLQGNEFEEMARQEIEGLVNTARCNRRNSAPRISRSSDGIPNRAHRIKALGNAIVPQVAEVFTRAIYKQITCAGPSTN